MYNYQENSPVPHVLQGLIDAVLHRGLEDASWRGRATTLEPSVVWAGVLLGGGEDRCQPLTPPTPPLRAPRAGQPHPIQNCQQV